LVEWSAAAVIVLVLAGIVAAFQFMPDDDRPSLPATATDATPPTCATVTALGSDEADDRAECITESRPQGTADVIGTEVDARTDE
jgi:hypothetical protein